jgi:hypothetical protein
MGIPLRSCSIFSYRFFIVWVEKSIMKQNLSKKERILRTGAGLVIATIGIYAALIKLLPGLLVLGIGLFTVFEGCVGCALTGVLAEAWIKPGGGNIESRIQKEIDDGR